MIGFGLVSLLMPRRLESLSLAISRKYYESTSRSIPLTTLERIDREVVDDIEPALVDEWRSKRRDVESHVRAIFEQASDPKKAFLRTIGLAPDSAIYAAGLNNGDVGVKPGTLYDPDPGKLTYRLKPNVKGAWLTPDHPLKISSEHHLESMLAIELVPAIEEAFDAADRAGIDLRRYLLPATFATNSWGLRGPEPDPEAPYRILMLGDSFAVGFAVSEDATIAAQFGQVLGLSDDELSVVNAGGVGYGPSDYYHWLMETLEQGFVPQVVIVNICGTNDFGDLAREIRKSETHNRGSSVPRGHPDWPSISVWKRGKHYTHRIIRECWKRDITFFFAVAPEKRLFHHPHEQFVAGLAALLGPHHRAVVINPFDRLMQAHVRLSGSLSTSNRSTMHLENDRMIDLH